MNRRSFKKSPTSTVIRATVLLALVAAFLGSCASFKFNNMKDDELIAGGVKAWNTEKPESARPYWSHIRVEPAKSTWLSYIDQYATLDKAIDDAAALPASNEAALLAAWENVTKLYKSFPPELNLPPSMKTGLAPVAKAIVRQRINANKSDAARDFIKSSSDFLGNSVDYSLELKELDYMVTERNQERSADGALSTARGKDDFNDQIKAYENAINAYAKVEDALAAQNQKQKFVDGSPLALAPDKVKKKRVDARVEMERKLRERAYSFKERIGEEFARTPDGNKLGSMGPEDILKFNEEIQANIESMSKELIDFSNKYPKVISKDMLKDVDDQKKALEARIAQVTLEVKHAKDIASRGKAVMPLLIGLFNPQPGTKGNDQKSRPGKYRGNLAGNADYWWGMVAIPANTMNDLVITVNDNRPVRVYAQNTLSGSLITPQKLKDLVNHSYKVGNSWPVLNAGAQLTSGNYYFELQKSKGAAYSGDVVIYSSFIMRMR